MVASHLLQPYPKGNNGRQQIWPQSHHRLYRDVMKLKLAIVLIIVGTVEVCGPAKKKWISISLYTIKARQISKFSCKVQERGRELTTLQWQHLLLYLSLACTLLILQVPASPHRSWFMLFQMAVFLHVIALHHWSTSASSTIDISNCHNVLQYLSSFYVRKEKSVSLSYS